MWANFYQRGLMIDEAANETIQKFKLKVAIPAVQKNMRDIFVKVLLGHCGEYAAEAFLVPETAKMLAGNNEPDFILEDSKTIYEVKIRKKHGHQASVQTLVRDECAYVREWLSRGYTLTFFYCLYNKQQVSVEEWIISV